MFEELNIGVIKTQINSYEKQIREFIRGTTEYLAIPQGQFTSIQLATRNFIDNDDYNCDLLDQAYAQYVESFVTVIISDFLNGSYQPEDSLRLIWKGFQKVILYIDLLANLLDYQNREFYVRKRRTTIYNRGILIYEKHFYLKLKKTALNDIFILLTNERQGVRIEEQTLKDVVKIFEFISIKNPIKTERNEKTGLIIVVPEADIKKQDYDAYRRHFEESLILNSIDFYRSRLSTWETNCNEYVKHVLNVLIEEENRTRNYFIASIHNLCEALELFFINKKESNQRQEILKFQEMGEAFKKNLLDEKENEVKNFYSLFSRNKYRPYNDYEQGMKLAESNYKRFIEIKGTSFGTLKTSSEEEKRKQPFTYVGDVRRLLEISKKYETNLWQKCTFMKKGMEEGFRSFLNAFGNAPRFLSITLDFNLKSKDVAMNEETYQKIREHLAIYEFLFNRDIFLNDYLRALGDRLIDNTSQSEEVEKYLISQLKLIQGQQELTKAAKRLDDIKSSKEEDKEFKDYSRNFKDLAGMELSIKILTNGSWNFKDNIEGIIKPLEMNRMINLFQEFYNKKYHGARNLNWLFTFGKGEISYPSKKCILQVTTIQIIILINFNTRDSFTLEEFLQFTGINFNEENVGIHLERLVDLKIIIKMDSNVDEAGKKKSVLYRINNEFVSERRLLVCYPIKKAKNPIAHGPDCTCEPCAELRKQRENILDAFIIRVMKARKNLSFNQIIGEAAHGITLFQCQPNMVKRRIESLLERGYLRRGENDPRTYDYLP